MFSKKISRRNFLKASAITTAMAAVGLPAFAEQPEDEKLHQDRAGHPPRHRQHRGQGRAAE